MDAKKSILMLKSKILALASSYFSTLIGLKCLDMANVGDILLDFNNWVGIIYLKNN